MNAHKSMLDEKKAKLLDVVFGKLDGISAIADQLEGWAQEDGSKRGDELFGMSEDLTEFVIFLEELKNVSQS